MPSCALATSSHFCQTLMKALAKLAKLSHTERLKSSSSFGGSECFARQTDRQTDRWTDRQTCLFGVSYNKYYIDHNFQITKNYKQQVIN